MKYFDRTSSVRILEHTEEVGVMGLEEDAVAYNALAHAHKGILDYAFAQQYLKTPRTGKILDIGTGPGLIPIYMVQQNPHLNIVAIDPSPKMIELAYQNAKEAGVEGKILFDIATSNQYEKGFFDHVFSHHVMHHFEHPEHLIMEAIRATKPQGTIHIRDLKRPATFGGIDFFVDFLGGPIYKKIKDKGIQQRGVTEYRNSLNAALSHKEWQDLEYKMQEYGFHLKNAGFFGITHRDLIRD